MCFFLRFLFSRSQRLVFNFLACFWTDNVQKMLVGIAGAHWKGAVGISSDKEADCRKGDMNRR